MKDATWWLLDTVLHVALRVCGFVGAIWITVAEAVFGDRA